MESYEFHPAANIFPLEDETMDALAADIKTNGQQCPIELCDEKIIDGRRRYMACRIAGVEAEFVTVSPADPVTYVMSLNYHRRHLSTTQRGIAAARAREFYDKEAKSRQKVRSGGQPGAEVENLPPLEKSKARDAAGAALGVSGKTVDYASKVLRNGTPELIKAVDSDKIAISTAARLSGKSPQEQKAFLASTKGGRPTARQVNEDFEEPTPAGESRGVGVQRAHEAIACLKKIPVNDSLRKRGLQIVSDWIKHNK